MDIVRLYDLREIAEALSADERGVRKRANKGRKGNKNHPAEAPWIVHSTVKKNGPKTRLFEFSTLPQDVQKAINKWEKLKAIEEQTQAVIDSSIADEETRADDYFSKLATKEQDKEREQLKVFEEGLKKFNSLKKEERERARGKEFVILKCRAFIEENGFKKISGINTFCDRLKHGFITIPDRFKSDFNTLNGCVSVNTSTLRGWDKQLTEMGIYGLSRNYGNRKGKNKVNLNPKLKEKVLGAMSKNPHAKAIQIKQYIQADSPELDIASAKCIGRFMETWIEEHEQEWTKHTNPDKWKNNFQPAFGSHHDQITRLNELWELDSTPGDWGLTDGRHSVIGIIDMYSRRFKLHVSKTSTAVAVCHVFRKSILSWGLPEAIRTDNGKDYVSDHFTEAVKDLKVHQYKCLPFASEQKGTVERAFQTMSHGILELLPGFIGHNVPERKVIEARKSFAKRLFNKDEVIEVSLSSDELQEILDKWAEHVYGKNEHSGLNGKTPFEMATDYKGQIRTIKDERALDLLFADGGTRTITKKGIAVNNHNYFEAVMGPLVGNKIRFKHTDDMGKIIVYDLEGKGFICEALCHTLLGISPIEAANTAKAYAKKVTNENMKVLKEARKHVHDNMAEEVLKYRIEQSKNISAFPQQTEEYTTPALEGAIQAADHRDGINQPSIKTNENDIKAQQEIEQMMLKPAPVIQMHDTPEQRYARAYALERKEALDKGDANWLKVYQEGSEYKSMKDFHEDFGITPEWSEAK